MDEFSVDLKKELVEQFKGKANIKALVEVLESELQEIADFYEQLHTQRNLKRAVGKQLDGVGDIVVLSRTEAGILAGNPIPFDVIDDEMYRQYLIFKILKNTCDCTYPDIIKAFRMFWDRPLYYQEDPSQPATMIFDTGEMDGSVDTRPLFNVPLLRAAGVTLKLYVRTKTTLEPAKVYIGSGLGFAITVTELPPLERDYNFRSKVLLAGRFQSVSQDELPIVERDYKFGFRFSLCAGIQSVSYDDLPFVEREICCASEIGSGNVTQNIIETPIGNASALHESKTKREENENE